MKDYLIELLDYERWANLRVINTLAPITNPPERAVAVVRHIPATQHTRYGRMANESVHVSIGEVIPISWMIETAGRQHDQLVSYVEILPDNELGQSISYTDSKGITYRNTRLAMLTHMSHHAAYHRGQVVQLTRPLVNEAPVTDFIA